MEHFKDYTLTQYCEVLSSKKPIPGGGSAAALSGALGASLISMVVNYSLGKKSPETDKRLSAVLEKSEHLRKQFLELVDLDADAYLGVVNTRKADEATRQAALQKAREVPLKIAQSCYEATELMPVLVTDGNPYLLSDVEVAMELLGAAFKSAMFNVKANQS